jgi:hypothetical protein
MSGYLAFGWPYAAPQPALASRIRAKANLTPLERSKAFNDLYLVTAFDEAKIGHIFPNHSLSATARKLVEQVAAVPRSIASALAATFPAQRSRRGGRRRSRGGFGAIDCLPRVTPTRPSPICRRNEAPACPLRREGGLTLRQRRLVRPGRPRGEWVSGASFRY